MGSKFDRNKKENFTILKEEKSLADNIKKKINVYLINHELISGNLQNPLNTFNPLTSHLYFKISFLYFKQFMGKSYLIIVDQYEEAVTKDDDEEMKSNSESLSSNIIKMEYNNNLDNIQKILVQNKKENKKKQVKENNIETQIVNSEGNEKDENNKNEVVLTNMSHNINTNNNYTSQSEQAQSSEKSNNFKFQKTSSDNPLL